MKRLRPQFGISSAMTFVMLIAASCGTPTQMARAPRPSTDDKEATPPFLDRGQYPESLGLILHEVLAKHRFSLPWMVVRGSDSSTWFVVDRFESEHRFDRLYVHVDFVGGATASMMAYNFGPSDWAILGQLFADFKPEATTITAEINKKLEEEGHAGK